jgi:hypothetical protein
MLWAFLLLNASIILLVARIRYGGRGLSFASPFPLPPTLWWWAGGASALTGVIAASADLDRLAVPGVPRALLELLAIFPSLVLYFWAVYPRRHRLRDYPALVLFAALIFCFFWSGQNGYGLTGHNFLPAVRALLFPTALMVAFPLMVSRWHGGQLNPRLVLTRLVVYCGWGLAQLLVFQVFLVPRLSLLASSDWQVIVGAATLFALVHWPNGTLMAACAVAGVIWTAVFVHHPNVYALTLSMACAASAFGVVMPRTILLNVGVGPIYVRARLFASTSEAVVRTLSSPEFYARQGGTQEDFVDALYRDILGRQADPMGKEYWAQNLEHGALTRAQVVRNFLCSAETRARLKQGPFEIADLSISW